MKALAQPLLSVLVLAAALGIVAHPAWAGEGPVTASHIPFTNDNPIFMYVGIAGAIVVVLAIILFVIQRKNK